ncbi:hypothetical protein BASA81_012635 [Batrachochytrium salamandrivorans]|nr:hypothetical protein BASA81_012635 [Batrachochytrium salamandrivorans]
MSSTKTKKAAMALAPIISAALIGASFQLVFYPQVVLGVLLLGLGTAMKLYSAWVGIALLLILVPLVLGLLLLLHTRLQRGLPHAVVTLVSRLAPKVFGIVKTIPPSVIITAAFALPAIGQVNASFSMVRMLVKVGAESSVYTISFFSLASATLTLLVQVFGVLNSAYMTPGKISFVLNSLWILKSLIVDGNTRPGGQSVFPFLTTMVLGWSSLILSSLPDKAVLNASQAAMKAAMVSAAVASSGVAVVAVVNSRATTTAEVEDIVNTMDQQDGEQGVSEAQKSEFLQRLVEWISNQLRELGGGKLAKLQLDFDQAANQVKLTATEASNKVKDQVLETSDLVFAKINSELETAPDATAAIVVIVEEEEEGNGVEQAPVPVAMLQAINPPVPVAIAIAIIRAVPTLIVFVLVECIGLYHVVVKQSPVKEVFFPVTLLPFVIAELFGLAKRVGVKRGMKQLYRLGVNGADTDGMSVLLWQSPKLLAIWNQFKLADSRIGEMLFASSPSPKSLLFPSEEYIGEAPNPDRGVWIKLIGSIVIDAIGVSTFALPGVGETFDVIWAPISGFIIQQVYGSPGFAFLGFAEEILPFTDVLPTATIAWVWLFASEIPVWVIRVVRAAKSHKHKSQ